MDVKLAFLLGLFFVVTINGDVRQPPKTCEGPSSISGGSLNDMVGYLYPCNVEQDNQKHRHHQNNDSNESDEHQETTFQEPQDPRFDKHRSQQIAESVLELSQRLTENILKQKSKTKFEVVSPISIASAIQLALLASHGVTFNELMDLMDYNTKEFSQYPYMIHEEFGFILEDLVNNSPNPSRNRPSVPWRAKASKEYLRKAMKYQKSEPDYSEHKISVANGIFVQHDFTIRDEFKEVVEKVYKSDIHTLDFRGNPYQSAQFLNSWVNEKTNGKIKELISGNISPETRVILANALYFKAEWQETFIEGATGLKKFYPYGKDNDYSIMVELMAHGGKFPHYYDPVTNSDILGFPYKQNVSTMYVILPKNSSEHRLREVQSILTADKIESLIDKMTIRTAVALFPKMHLSGGHHLKTNLMDLGLQTLFQPLTSDLSVMSDGSYRNTRQQSINRVGFNPKQQLIFGRMGESDNSTRNRTRRDVTYKVDSEKNKSSSPLSLKDFMIRKRIVKKTQGKKLRRNKRQYSPFSLERLELIRNMKTLVNPKLFAEEVIHKVDLTINEKGTEGGAATAITLNRSGTNVVFRVDTPFMFLIRHDTTRVPLFYGVVFEPQN